MTPTSPVRIWWDASISAYHLTSPYNKDFKDTLLGLVPASDRSWDPATKIWTFTEKWLQPTINLAETVLRTKPQVVTRKQVEQAASSPATSQNIPIDTVLVQFMRAIPYEAAQKAYRTAAMLLHPDRGGDMAKMSAVNSAWSRIEKEIYHVGVSNG
jgi:hypothetical protein